jgi:hypothetical protein
VTVPMLAAGLYGYAEGFYAAMPLCAAQVVQFYGREKTIAAFPVQVRVAYPGLPLFAKWQPCYWLYWLQLVGTSHGAV